MRFKTIPDYRLVINYKKPAAFHAVSFVSNVCYRLPIISNKSNGCLRNDAWLKTKNSARHTNPLYSCTRLE